MSIVGGFDVHRRQITFDYVDTDTGRLQRGRITPACRAVLRRWLAERFAERPDVAFAVEACTGWRIVVEECERAGIEASLAETAEALAPAGHQAVTGAVRFGHALDPELDAVHRQIRTSANGKLGCGALQPQYGVGPIPATVIGGRMGDTRRFTASRQAVRHTG